MSTFRLSPHPIDAANWPLFDRGLVVLINSTTVNGI
jgi:hypothetical protein